MRRDDAADVGYESTMTHWNTGGTPRSRAPDYTDARESSAGNRLDGQGAATPTAPTSSGAVSELTALSQTLATTQEQSRAAWQQIKALAETNALLRRDLARLEEQIQRVRLLALYDELTGLPNRVLLMDRISQAVLRADREKSHVGLLFLDLNGFKEINDRLGHTAGDVLLREVAHRLTDCLRAGDTAGRYGGDEFIILLPDIRARESAETVAQKVQARLATPFLLHGELVTVTTSIGTSTYPEDGEQPIDLIGRADVAMYRAKADSYEARPAPPQ